MDSGIESTESSNGSISDTCNNINDIQNEERHNTGGITTEEPLKNTFREPYTTGVGLSATKHKKLNINKIETTFNSNDANCEKSFKTSLSPRNQDDECFDLAADAKIENKDNSHITMKKENLSDSEMKSCEKESENAKPLSIPRLLSANLENEFQIPSLPVPKGCCLKLNFPKVETEASVIHEQATPFEAFSAYSFANGPFQVNSQSYSGSLAVLPYESRELQRKFKHYRRRLRQIISTKPREKKLRIASSLNNVELVQKLLSEGVDPKATDDKDRTALHIAASKGYTQIVKLLLQHGADPNQKDSIGNTPLHLAACTSHIDTVTVLLKGGNSIKQTDNQGYSPLHLAYSRLKLLQKDPHSSSGSLRAQVYEIVEMMREYLKSSGNTQEAELLSTLTSQLTLSDDGPSGEEELKQLMTSLQDLTLSKTKRD